MLECLRGRLLTLNQSNRELQRKYQRLETESQSNYMPDLKRFKLRYNSGNSQYFRKPGRMWDWNSLKSEEFPNSKGDRRLDLQTGELRYLSWVMPIGITLFLIFFLIYKFKFLLFIMLKIIKTKETCPKSSNSFSNVKFKLWSSTLFQGSTEFRLIYLLC